MVQTLNFFAPEGMAPARSLRAAARRVAVVGSGIAGLGAALRLREQDPAMHVTLYERSDRLGGHAHTVDVTLPDAHGRAVTHGVDTGFLVFNERTYPALIELLEALGVATAASDMSFSVQSTALLAGAAGRLEWSGSNLNTVFAQRRNLRSWPFWSMLGQVLRFNREATALATRGDDAALHESVSDFLNRRRFDRHFRDGYLLPMIACIWSCPVQQMLAFPVGTLIRFCHNHGLLQVRDRPQWFTVRGGSRHGVQAIARQLPDVRVGSAVNRVYRDASGITVQTDHTRDRFDALVLACHAPQALAVLGEGASPLERRVLGAMRTQTNQAVLHTDASVMPQARRAWAAWNFERASNAAADAAPVCLHYWINRLQPLPFDRDVFVSLNPARPPRGDLVLNSDTYEHPVFDAAALLAQDELPSLQGVNRTWFAGAWCGYGFHEDGLTAGQAAADGVLRHTHAHAHAHAHPHAQRAESMA